MCDEAQVTLYMKTAKATPRPAMVTKPPFWLMRELAPPVERAGLEVELALPVEVADPLPPVDLAEPEPVVELLPVPAAAPAAVLEALAEFLVLEALVELLVLFPLPDTPVAEADPLNWI